MIETTTANNQPIDKHASSDLGRLLRMIDHWSTDGFPFDPRQFRGHLESTRVGVTHIHSLSLSGDVIVRVSPDPGFAGVLFVGSCENDLSLNGFNIDQRAVWHAKNGGAAYIRSKRNATVFLIGWDEDDSLLPTGRYLGPQDHNIDYNNPSGLLLRTRNSSAHVDVLRRVMRVAQNDSVDRTLFQESQMVDAVAASIIDALSGSATNDYYSTLSRHRFELFTKAFERLNRSANLRYTTPHQLSVDVGIHVRTLQEIFREFIDMTPKQFTRLVQLHRIKDYLRYSPERVEPLSSIARVAGFSSPSHFAASYKAVFGAPPSKTVSSNTAR